MKVISSKEIKANDKLRMAIAGPSGSGKTFTSLKLAERLGKRTLLIETERDQEAFPASGRYADMFEFDLLRLSGEETRPLIVAKAIREYAENYDTLIVDSASPSWYKLLEIVDKASEQTGNKFSAWKFGTPQQNQFTSALTGAKSNVIVTLRTKQGYSMEKGDDGRTKIVKLGLEPIQRDDFEYEFDIFVVIDMSHRIVVQKARDPKKLIEGRIFSPEDDFEGSVIAWLKN